MPSVLCPVLVGRGTEVDELGAALATVADDRRGTTHLLIGEAGVGKSRLAREVLELARRRNFTVLWGRATPSAGQVAFRPLAEALLSHFRDAGPPVGPELEPFRPILARLVPEWRGNGGERADESLVLLAEAVLRVLRVLGRPHGCLLVLEDLHWADPDTMAILEYLADNLASEPVMCLGHPAVGGVDAGARRRRQPRRPHAGRGTGTTEEAPMNPHPDMARQPAADRQGDRASAAAGLGWRGAR